MNTIEPKFVMSRIAFDLASAIKAHDGKLPVDEALLIAAVPCVLVDYANESDFSLKRIVREMRHFYQRNPRYTKFRKEAVAEGLRLQWLPNVEDSEKNEMLTDIPFILGVDADGYIIYNQALYDTYVSKERPDLEKYGQLDYTRFDTNAGKIVRDTSKILKKYHDIDAEGYEYVNLDISSDEWYNIILEASQLVKEYLGCYIQIPNEVGSVMDVEKLFGIDWQCISARNTALGQRAQRLLGIEVYHDETESERHFWSTPMLKGRKKGHFFHWQMRPELLEAAKRLAKEESWELPQPIKQ